MSYSMMRILFHIYLLSAVVLAVFGTSARADQRISDVLAANALRFGHNVGLELSALNTNVTENIIFSPLCLMTALSLLTLGAKSKTYQELNNLLGLDSDSELIQSPTKFHEEFGLMLNDLQHKNGGIINRPNANWRFTNLERTPVRPARFRVPMEHIIKVNNGLFVQNGYSLNLDYSQVLKLIYETEFTQLDFQNRNVEAGDYINRWVEKATLGKIPKVITDRIDRTTKVILVSTLYFKAFWDTQFYEQVTMADDFFLDGEHNPAIKVQMMITAGAFPFYDAKEHDCRIIGLPYRDDETTMYVIQPNYSTRQKLRYLQSVLDVHHINNMINKMERKTTRLFFPKMHFKTKMNMKNIFQSMNVHDLFKHGYSDLSLIGQIPQVGFARANVAENPPPPKSAADISIQSIYRKKPTYESVQSSSTFLQDVAAQALSNLESLRRKADSYKSDLYVDDIIHNVDFAVDEQGTEAAAVTHATIRKTGPEVTFKANAPFLIIIRHDPTKLPLFYGVINKPEL